MPNNISDHFFYRQRELARLCAAMRSRRSIQLFGLRRIGKSYLLLRAQEALEMGEHVAVGATVVSEVTALPPLTVCNVSVQSIDSIGDFFIAIQGALPTQIRGRWRAILDGTKQVPRKILDAVQRRVREGEIAGVKVAFQTSLLEYWRPMADSLKEVLAGTDPPVVLFIDELPFMIKNMVDKVPAINEAQREETIAAVKQLLATLRSWQQAQIPMVLAGSISLPFLLQDLELSEVIINELERIDLPPLDVVAEEPRHMLEKLVKGEGLRSWTEETYDQVLSRIDDPFPFFIDRAFEKLKTEDRSDEAYIDKVFRNEIWPDSRHVFYKQFDERLRDRFPDAKKRSLVRRLLKAIGANEQGLGFDEIETFVAAEDGDGSIDAAQHVELLVGLDFLVLHYQTIDTASSQEPPRYKLALNTIRSWLAARSV